MIHLEVPVYTLESALAAYKGGAHRLEICSGRESGGETPDYETTQNILKQVKIPCMIMIRPRGGNFVYTAAELDLMKEQIKKFNTLPVAGFVFGILNDAGEVDEKSCRELIELSGKPCTFHRAIDVCANIFDALESIIRCGFSNILTSGTKPKAIEGLSIIERLIAQARERINIIPGSGINPDNAHEFIKLKGITYLHSSCGEVNKNANNSFMSSASGETQQHIVEAMIKLITSEL